MREDINNTSERAKLHDKKARCKCKYRMRWFYSKGAFLILVWTTLVSVAGDYIVVNLFHLLRRIFTTSVLKEKFVLLPAVLLILLVILLGWLADIKYGNYKVARFGLTLQFFGALTTSICLLLINYLHWK